MCMDKNLYIIHMKYVMYSRTEGNKYRKKNHNADRPTLNFPIHVTRTTGFFLFGLILLITFRIVLLAYTMFILLS